MPAKRLVLPLIAVIAMLTLAGCPGRGTPPQEKNTLVYSGPTELSLAPGETLPLTDIVFLGMEEGHGLFTIGEFRATRQIGDSLDWDGEPLPGVSLSLRLRILWFRGGRAQLAGTVRIEVRDVQATEGKVDESAAVAYRIPVKYRVPKGERIPGTTWEYVGATPRGAELGGIEEYPFRKVADSILWEGHLRPGVGLALNLRVVYFDDQALQVAGLATVTLKAAEKGE